MSNQISTEQFQERHAIEQLFSTVGPQEFPQFFLDHYEAFGAIKALAVTPEAYRVMGGQALMPPIDGRLTVYGLPVTVDPAVSGCGIQPIFADSV